MTQLNHKLSPLAILLVAVFLHPTGASAQNVQPSAFSLEGHYDIQTNGNDTSYMSGLTHRYVDGDLRFLTLTHRGVLHEFRRPAAFGQTQWNTTATWDLSGTGALNNHVGIWYEQSHNRLWVTSAEDYTVVNHPAKVTLLSLGTGGSVVVQKQFFLNVPAKRVYGGCSAVPAALVAQLGGPYVCGWGGYTSLVAQGGGASIGPTMYTVPDPDSISNGATVSARTILDHATTRGLRQTIPVNYFDGGDPRQNPSSPPTEEPLSSASWLSPNNEGLGWMVWGDSYYNTGMWIGTTFASIASLCQGKCWYMDSTLNFDARQFELHMWNGSSLGNDHLRRPDSMTELHLPQGIVGSWSGNVPQRNVSGATFDPVSGRAFLVIFPAGSDWHTGRLYSFTVSGTGGGTLPPPGDSTAPTVSLSSPSAGSTVSGTVTLSATASDNTGVASVWFTANGTTVGAEDTTAPYQASWNTTQVANGTYSVRALARDAANNIGASQTISVTVNNASTDTTAPTVSLSAPASGATVSGTVTVSATASDNVGVTSVQFTLNGVNLGTADTTSPYAISWNTTGAANGTHTLRAVARDAAGNVTTSASRSVTVSNQSSDTTAPTVSLTSPTSGATVGGTVTVSAAASDNVGVASVQFTLNGVALGAADTVAPYAISWDTLGALNGTHTIGAVARDLAGNVRSASVAYVTVFNAAATTTCSTPDPFVSLGGGTCVNGGWLPPNMTLSPTPSEPTTSTPPPTTTSPTACTTPQPGPNWTCHNGGWLPPGMVPPSGSTSPAPTPPPATPSSSSTCTSPWPGEGWVCRGGGWVPVSHPGAG